MEELVLKLTRKTDGIFNVLRVNPEHIIKLQKLPSGGTEVTIRESEGTTTLVDVMHSETEITELINKCKEQRGSADSDA
ncbi:MAG: hypothetical protein ACYSWZ_17475 [Planctomycetota bacterium]|jgi:hypothetical protein